MYYQIVALFNYDINKFGSSGIGINRAPISMIFGAVSDPDTATWAQTGLTLWSNQRLSLTADDNSIIDYLIDKWLNGTTANPSHTLSFGNIDIDDFFIYSGNNMQPNEARPTGWTVYEFNNMQ